MLYSLLLFQNNITHFKGLVEEYAQYNVTKLQLADKINYDLQLAMQNTIEEIIVYMNYYAMQPMRQLVSIL